MIKKYGILVRIELNKMKMAVIIYGILMGHGSRPLYFQKLSNQCVCSTSIHLEFELLFVSQGAKVCKSNSEVSMQIGLRGGKIIKLISQST